MAHRFVPVRLAPASLGVPAHLFREDGVTRPTGQQLYEALHRHASELAADPPARGDAAPASASPAGAPEGGGRERDLVAATQRLAQALDRLDRLLTQLDMLLAEGPEVVELPHLGRVK